MTNNKKTHFLDDAQWFSLVQIEPNNYTLTVVDEGIKIENRKHLVFSLVAKTTENINIHAAVIISLTGIILISFVEDSN